MKRFFSKLSLGALICCMTIFTVGAKKLTKKITIDSFPRGSMVVLDGVPLGVTPFKFKVDAKLHTDKKTGHSFVEYNGQVIPIEQFQLNFQFLSEGLPSGSKIVTVEGMNGKYFLPDGIFYSFEGSRQHVPTQSNQDVVTRQNPGTTGMEKTIIRWNFDSDPRGARIFWRVISSIPDQVKNTNETYLTGTPYEETRSFNILGLTYNNSKDVTIEIKVTKRGYEDQVKRYNVRQALDQQEISGFFELVPKN